MSEFYSSVPTKQLRFGDVIQWGISTPAYIDNKKFNSISDFSVNIKFSNLSVIMTPCCTIPKQSKVSLAPLIPVKPSLFDNEYFFEDLTRINREVEPQNSIPALGLRTMPDEKRAEFLSRGKGYTNLNLFVYEANDFFPIYKNSNNIESNYYMIDFLDINMVEYSGHSPPENFLTNNKCLELTNNTRNELRTKLNFYYGRIPTEEY